MKEGNGAEERERQVKKLTRGLTASEHFTLNFKLFIWLLSYRYERQKRELAQVFLFLFIAAPLFGSDRYIFMQYYTLLFCVITAAALRRFIG